MVVGIGELLKKRLLVDLLDIEDLIGHLRFIASRTP